MGTSYLGVPLVRPRVAFFDLTGCEGCQLQVLNNEDKLLDFLALVDVVRFREAMTGGSDDYDIAFVEGSITRQDEVERIKLIRHRASTLVALGSCACFGGVNQLKNILYEDGNPAETVYGSFPVESFPARALQDVVDVDMRIYGCPISKSELERTVLSLALGLKPHQENNPVCMECKSDGNICLFELGTPCLGPVTRGGCQAWCTSRRSPCRGCRGPVDEPNMEQMRRTMKDHGFSHDTLNEMLACFGGFRKLKTTHETDRQ